MAQYPVVRCRYIDSAVRDRQHSVQDDLKPVVSEVSGFLICDSKDRVEIARELFFDGKYIDKRGVLSIPRCAVMGKIKKMR